MVTFHHTLDKKKLYPDPDLREMIRLLLLISLILAIGTKNTSSKVTPATCLSGLRQFHCV